VVSSQIKAQAEEWSFAVGEIIGAYRIEGVVGAGGMGAVYRARHVLANKTVAVKVMREDQLAFERAVDRMMREASILASVAHPGLPTFYECGLLDDGRPWIAMELIDGISLSDCMHHGVLHADDVIDFVAAVAEVLAAAHDRGVTHRDLKPDNILLTPTDRRFRVRVIDWGIAHHLAGARFTSMNEAIGTPTYMAPEQARGGPTDGHCDVYGLGIVAYQALTGRPPFIGQSSVEILVQHLNKPVPALAPRCPDAPYGLVELVEQMLAKRYEERPTAVEVAQELRSLVARRSGRQSAIEDTGGIPLPVLDGNETPKTVAIRNPKHYPAK
jgi:serine/threonine protein kinase